ncbi:MAG: type II toxin-antitoxin system RelE/ParE family toxin [Bacteroidota bacterium]
MPIASKGKGKSGGARIMTFVKIEDTMVILFSMYNKGEKDTISDQEIKTLIKAALEKL